MSPAAGRIASGIVAFFAAAGLVLDYQAYVAGFESIRLFWRTIDFFSFFTIDANLLVTLVAAAGALTGESRIKAWLTRPAVSAAACLYAGIAGGTYFLLLRQLHHFVGWASIADDLLHYIVPPLFFALWLVALPKGGLTNRNLSRWLLWAAIYLGYALARGPGTGFSPYPFLDPAKLGAVGVAVNVAAFAVAFLGGGALLVALDRFIAGTRSRVPAN